MTRRRWIADAVDRDRAFLTGTHAQHLARVLRARIGQEFDIAIPGGVRLGKISHITDDRVEFALGDRVESSTVADITLLLAIFKFDRMEWAIEKCTELGVSRFIPLIARRTDTHLASAAAKRWERSQRLARQAAEQSRRATLPELEEPVNVSEAVQAQQGTRILLAENEQSFRLTDVLAESCSDSSFALAIGPEGGWTEDEAQLFASAGWTPASLGPTILRSETAAIAAVAIALSTLP
jgi:16S rRNA (uracil1498-N3)-methyltransferase